MQPIPHPNHDLRILSKTQLYASMAKNLLDYADVYIALQFLKAGTLRDAHPYNRPSL